MASAYAAQNPETQEHRTVTSDDASAAEQTPGADAASQPRSGQLTAITRAMVAIYKDQFGRGPRYAHSHYASRDAIVCFLEGSLTPVERTLAELGEHQRLRDIRLLFQYAAEDGFRSAVEAVTGRRVVAFVSGIDTQADLSTELFVLEPASEESERE
jgi:uncharacterized protein YbcI